MVFLNPPFPSGAIGFEGSTTISSKRAAMRSDKFLDRIEINRKDDDVRAV